MDIAWLGGTLQATRESHDITVMWQKAKSPKSPNLPKRKGDPFHCQMTSTCCPIVWTGKSSCKLLLRSIESVLSNVYESKEQKPCFYEIVRCPSSCLEQIFPADDFIYHPNSSVPEIIQKYILASSVPPTGATWCLWKGIMGSCYPWSMNLPDLLSLQHER